MTSLSFSDCPPFALAQSTLILSDSRLKTGLRHERDSARFRASNLSVYFAADLAESVPAGLAASVFAFVFSRSSEAFE